MRTTPEEVAPCPYEETAMNSSSAGGPLPAQRPGEVRHEHERALEDADQQEQSDRRVVGGDLLGESSVLSRISSSVTTTRSMSASYQQGSTAIPPDPTGGRTAQPSARGSVPAKRDPPPG